MQVFEAGGGEAIVFVCVTCAYEEGWGDVLDEAEAAEVG